jgi:NTP pyrophosphatase (non-canonical NTP hydrolase)
MSTKEPKLSGLASAALENFVFVMKLKLSENRHKGDSWRDDNAFDLLDRVIEEVQELRTALACLTEVDTPEAIANMRAAVWREAADVANMAMMVADSAELERPVVVPDSPYVIERKAAVRAEGAAAERARLVAVVEGIRERRNAAGFSGWTLLGEVLEAMGAAEGSPTNAK